MRAHPPQSHSHGHAGMKSRIDSLLWVLISGLLRPVEPIVVMTGMWCWKLVRMRGGDFGNSDLADDFDILLVEKSHSPLFFQAPVLSLTTSRNKIKKII